MKIKLIIISIILLLVMVFASGCIPIMEKLGLVSPTNEEQLTPEKGGPPDGLVKVLIGFKEKPGPPEQALVKGLGGKIKYTYNLIPAIAASVPDVAIEALKKNPNITNVELDSKVYALDTELDNSWGVKRIGAGVVHDSGNKGAGVKVAIIDTGLDYTHPDLGANYAGGYDFVNDDNNPMDDDITYGHGTHVAGIIAALDNDFGVVGVAPEASLYALKALNSEGVGYVSDVIFAIQWATDPDGDGSANDRLDIINMSLGADRGNIFFKWACNLAYRDGLLLVAAAGNYGAVCYPAAYSSVVAVSATDEEDNLASFSSTGSQVELAAPGDNIYSTYLNNEYKTLGGTSMASPHVVGTAALVWADKPGWSNKKVRAQLQNTADDLGVPGRDSQYGYGLVNAAKAAGVESPPPKYDLTVDILPEAAETDGASTAPATGTHTDYAAAGGSVTVVASDPSDGSWTFVNWTIGGTEVSTINSYTFTMPAADVSIVANFEAVPPPVTGTIMHVNDIAMGLETVVRGKNTFTYAIATVTIADDNIEPNPVEGATVSGHWSGATSDKDSGVTDTYGQVSLQSNKVKNPTSGVTTFTFTVDDVIKDGYTPLINVEMSDSITFP